MEEKKIRTNRIFLNVDFERFFDKYNVYVLHFSKEQYDIESKDFKTDEVEWDEENEDEVEKTKNNFEINYSEGEDGVHQNGLFPSKIMNQKYFEGNILSFYLMKRKKIDYLYILTKKNENLKIIQNNIKVFRGLFKQGNDIEFKKICLKSDFIIDNDDKYFKCELVLVNLLINSGEFLNKDVFKPSNINGLCLINGKRIGANVIIALKMLIKDNYNNDFNTNFSLECTPKKYMKVSSYLKIVQHIHNVKLYNRRINHYYRASKFLIDEGYNLINDNSFQNKKDFVKKYGSNYCMECSFYGKKADVDFLNVEDWENSRGAVCTTVIDEFNSYYKEIAKIDFFETEALVFYNEEDLITDKISVPFDFVILDYVNNEKSIKYCLDLKKAIEDVTCRNAKNVKNEDFEYNQNTFVITITHHPKWYKDNNMNDPYKTLKNPFCQNIIIEEEYSKFNEINEYKEVYISKKRKDGTIDIVLSPLVLNLINESVLKKQIEEGFIDKFGLFKGKVVAGTIQKRTKKTKKGDLINISETEYMYFNSQLTIENGKILSYFIELPDIDDDKVSSYKKDEVFHQLGFELDKNNILFLLQKVRVFKPNIYRVDYIILDEYIFFIVDTLNIALPFATKNEFEYDEKNNKIKYILSRSKKCDYLNGFTNYNFFEYNHINGRGFYYCVGEDLNKKRGVNRHIHNASHIYKVITFKKDNFEVVNDSNSKEIFINNFETLFLNKTARFNQNSVKPYFTKMLNALLDIAKNDKSFERNFDINNKYIDLDDLKTKLS